MSSLVTGCLCPADIYFHNTLLSLTQKYKKAHDSGLCIITYSWFLSVYSQPPFLPYILIPRLFAFTPTSFCCKGSEILHVKWSRLSKNISLKPFWLCFITVIFWNWQNRTSISQERCSCLLLNDKSHATCTQVDHSGLADSERGPKKYSTFLNNTWAQDNYIQMKCLVKH